MSNSSTPAKLHSSPFDIVKRQTGSSANPVDLDNPDPNPNPYSPTPAQTVPKLIFALPANSEDIIVRMGARDYKGLSGDRVRAALVKPFLGEIPASNSIPYHVNLPERLQLAGETGILDPENNDTYSDFTIVAEKVTNIVYIIHHRLTDNDLSTMIIPSKVPIGPERTQIMKGQRKRASEFQRKAFIWFRNGVQAARDLYDPDEFDCATPLQRKQIWDAIWESSPRGITQGMLGPTWVSVDLDGIFMAGADDEVRDGWRRAFRTLFTLLCGLMVDCRPGGREFETDVGKSRWFADWRLATGGTRFLERFPWWKTENLPIPRNIMASGRAGTYNEGRDTEEWLFEF